MCLYFTDGLFLLWSHLYICEKNFGKAVKTRFLFDIGNFKGWLSIFRFLLSGAILMHVLLCMGDCPKRGFFCEEIGYPRERKCGYRLTWHLGLLPACGVP